MEAGVVSFALQARTYVLDISIIERPSSPWEYGTFPSCVPAALCSFEAFRSPGRDSASLVCLLLFPTTRSVPSLSIPLPLSLSLSLSFFLLIISIPAFIYTCHRIIEPPYKLQWKWSFRHSGTDRWKGEDWNFVRWPNFVGDFFISILSKLSSWTRAFETRCDVLQKGGEGGLNAVSHCCGSLWADKLHWGTDEIGRTARRKTLEAIFQLII